jgi:ABC-type bacteriocin/lantibiotic exporter with double-glycine peptidase domain
MPGTLACAMTFGVLWTVPVALMPLAIGRAIDAALRNGAPAAGAADEPAGAVLGGDWGLGGSLWTWVGVLLVLGTVQVVSVGLLEYFSVNLWVRAAILVQRSVLRHATSVGAALPRKIRAGEVVAIGSSDVQHIGNALEVIGRSTGSLVAFVLVAAVVLDRSPLLGAVVLIGVPLATVGLTPLLGPLLRRTEKHREQVGAATTLAADIVSGLRVLRGIGGERRFADRFAETSQRVRRAGVSAGKIDSWLSGIEVLLPGLVTVAVTWLGARLALDGTITVGELVAFYGLSAFLVIPVGMAAQAVHSVSQALVAAGRAAAVLRLRPALERPTQPVPLPAGALGLADPDTGLRCDPGALTVVRPAGSSEQLADRLGRYVDSRVLAVFSPHSPAGLDERCAVGCCTSGAGRTVAAGREVALRDADLDEVRRRIVVAHNQDLLFSGRVAEEVQLGEVAPIGLDDVLWAADAADIVAGLPDGVHERLSERGRQLSGGQRQRLMLARALSADSDVLVLDDPTSAVDAHTEARIARRVAHLRRGRTTVVITQSPLWGAVADREVSQ